MSFMLTGYSEYGCQEFILPEMDNANHSISLDHKIFCIPEDIELYFDVVDAAWRFQGLSDNSTVGTKSVRPGQGIKAGDSIHISVGSMHIAIVVMEFTPNICGLQKYHLNSPCQLSIGCDQDNQIVCADNPLVSRHHAVLSVDASNCTISDQSTNGTFINGRRVRGTESIEYGTSINFFGIQIVWLGDVIAIGSKCGHIQCGLKKLTPTFFGAAISASKAASSKWKFLFVVLRTSPRQHH